MRPTTSFVSLRSLCVAAASLLAAPVDALAQSPTDVARAIEAAYAEVAERVGPSVLCVTAYVRENAGTADGSDGSRSDAWEIADNDDYPGFRRLASASGILIDSDGHLLTCRHQLVKPDGSLADLVGVEFRDNRRFVARIVGSEPTINLAVLRIESIDPERPPRLVVPGFGALESLRPGFTTIAIGDPFGPLQAFTPGVLTAFPNRDCYQADLTSTYVQTTMSVHPETLGGAVANLDGEVIAILMPTTRADGTVELDPPAGFSFSLPIGTALAVGEALRFKQTHASPWMGFSVVSLACLARDSTDADAFAGLRPPPTGLHIEDVYAPSPATKSDVRIGDFLVAIDGKPIATVSDFQRALYMAGIGATVRLALVRDGAAIERELTIEERPVAANRSGSTAR